MKSSHDLWKAQLEGKIAPDLARELDIFETEIQLRKQGKIDEKLFAETRLRRGAYGQRYDNGQRHDGAKVQQLKFPSGELTKGPTTFWDAPGMQRIKIPIGGLNAEQLEVLADLAEEYSDGIAHVTTRQDFQLHFIHIDDTPALMRRLAAVGITTREACGNSVRNVTACPYAGVCADEAFDVSPYARALAKFLLGHPDCQDFGRKFKPAFSGCKQHACGLVNIHDVGGIARVREENGQLRLGFEYVVGGGLGAVPFQAKIFDEFLPPEELLPTTQAIARVFARLGEKKNRNRARLKFLIKDLGLEKFQELVREERKILPHDPRWTGLIEAELNQQEKPLREGGELPSGGPDDFQRWLKTNIRPQRQKGYSVATVTLPLGDITPDQLRALADIARRFTHETLRTTVEQNIVLRWVSNRDLPDLYAALKAVGLGASGAGNIFDVVACPGTDTCKLGISASRGLAGELRKRLGEQAARLDQAVQNLHIKVSGCFNSCGQHHVADMGFYGVSRKAGNYTVPHFQVLLGGQWENNGGAYGLPIVAIPSKNIPAVVERLTGRFAKERGKGESFQDFYKRLGKVETKTMLEDLIKIPDHDSRPEYYSDWGDTREYTIGDIGTGECAGEVVSIAEFELAAAEREYFEAQVLYEKDQVQKSGETAFRSMVTAARALVKTEFLDVPAEADRVIEEFRKRFYDTQKFWDPFAGGKFGQMLFIAHQKAKEPYNAESAHHLLEEAQLFIDAAHSCYNKMAAQPAAPKAEG
ncbi:MAG: nitrite/sulfite reductase [Deltaproteobacteria bacterium]|nr:nitrite/sulfite reductase [Deltaproteobacteria bacterium]